MTKSASEISDDFEFIETPAAPTPVAPTEDYGVRTTTASLFAAQLSTNTTDHSTQ